MSKVASLNETLLWARSIGLVKTYDRKVLYNPSATISHQLLSREKTCKVKVVL